MKQTVYARVNPFVHRVYLAAQFFWIIIEGRFVRGQELVESRVEEADNLRAFVIYDGIELFVPKDGDGESRGKHINKLSIRLHGNRKGYANLPP